MKKPKFNPLITKNNIQVLQLIRGERNTVVLLKNNNPYNIGISAKLIFKDDEGLMIDQPVDSNYSVRPFESAQVIALIFNNPEDFGIQGGSIDPIELFVEDAHELPSISHVIHPSVQLGRDGWMIKYETTSEREVNCAHCVEILYDHLGNLLDVHDCGINVRVPGETDIHQYYYPEYEQGGRIKPTKYEVYIDSVEFA